ncbi:VWA domain-containing protein [Parashewanella tropica]|uniref:VWA domain-containing protein n=1 Tax=Parashewanella tropica TaxID=2547970 RepID=UPI0010598CF2|nr:VWA domain-containing protein [Parashewanella tropica]
MNNLINIIVDTSGSMNDMGKIHLQRNLCRYADKLRAIEFEKYSKLDIRFYQWAQNVSEVALQIDGDIPVLSAKGSSNLCELSGFLNELNKDKEKARVLILSDGNFPNSYIVSFQNQMDIFSSLLIRTVAVGADADLLKLKKISTNNTVYLSENIASAIESTIFGSDESLNVPISTAQIVEPAPAETEEAEEDWDA